ncbi:MAG: sigma-54-dependent Fis family transcriptional regulator [Deltaproteobacteria bacterium]|nr:sigma-54-dependent Fis family transcriptional regulator [Deltaproteobacteria bacterium]
MTGKVLLIGFLEKPDKKVGSFLSKEGWELVEETPVAILGTKPVPSVDVALLSFGNEEVDGATQAIQKLRSGAQEIPVVCLTRLSHVDQAVMIMKSGAFDCLQTPVDMGKLSTVLKNAAQTARLKKKVLLLESQVGWEGKFDDMVGVSPQIREIFQMVHTVAKSNATALILGESGTGKELVARAIHRHSERSKNKFIDINCAAIPRELLENELFGHERGAFTGADG